MIRMPYRGPGGPDPSKPRADRERELLAMMNTESGRDIIGALAREAMGVQDGALLPPGILYSQMVAAVLDHEYPPAAE